MGDLQAKEVGELFQASVFRNAVGNFRIPVVDLPFQTKN